MDYFALNERLIRQGLKRAISPCVAGKVTKVKVTFYDKDKFLLTVCAKRKQYITEGSFVEKSCRYTFNSYSEGCSFEYLFEQWLNFLKEEERDNEF